MDRGRQLGHEATGNTRDGTLPSPAKGFYRPMASDSFVIRNSHPPVLSLPHIHRFWEVGVLTLVSLSTKLKQGTPKEKRGQALGLSKAKPTDSASCVLRRSLKVARAQFELTFMWLSVAENIGCPACQMLPPRVSQFGGRALGAAPEKVESLSHQRITGQRVVESEFKGHICLSKNQRSEEHMCQCVHKNVYIS